MIFSCDEISKISNPAKRINYERISCLQPVLILESVQLTHTIIVYIFASRSQRQLVYVCLPMNLSVANSLRFVYNFLRFHLIFSAFSSKREKEVIGMMPLFVLHAQSRNALTLSSDRLSIICFRFWCGLIEGLNHRNNSLKSFVTHSNLTVCLITVEQQSM